MAAHGLDKEQVRKLGKHRRRTRTAARHFLCGVLEGRPDPLGGPHFLDFEDHGSGQARYDWVALYALIAKEAADHPRRCSAAAMMDGCQLAAGRGYDDVCGLYRCQAEVTAHQVPVIAGEQDQLAAAEPLRLTAIDDRMQFALDHVMIGNEVRRRSEERRAELRGHIHRDAPG